MSPLLVSWIFGVIAWLGLLGYGWSKRGTLQPASPWTAVPLVGLTALIAVGGWRVIQSLPARTPTEAPGDPRQGPPQVFGAHLYKLKGCVACHSVDGSPRVGPSFQGRWGTEVLLVGGAKVKMDEAYVRESLRNPAG